MVEGYLENITPDIAKNPKSKENIFKWKLGLPQFEEYNGQKFKIFFL